MTVCFIQSDSTFYQRDNETEHQATGLIKPATKHLSQSRRLTRLDYVNKSWLQFRGKNNYATTSMKRFGVGTWQGLTWTTSLKLQLSGNTSTLVLDPTSKTAAFMKCITIDFRKYTLMNLVYILSISVHFLRTWSKSCWFGGQEVTG